ncbi:MAG: histidine phosphatase family protein [Clostridia bacterium]|nr:histidine phosphatase family protein [Clostridia bacterium]MBR2925096.1 histidine phosphatase family protein [Clostridia bacterium]
MKLLIIRHGESEADILSVHEGRADFNLTDKGHSQAQAMADYVSKNYSIDKIYASPLKRALQTATHLSEATGTPIVTNENLMEFNNGLIAGLSWEEADAKYPKVPSLPIHAAVYEQESKLEFRHRAEYILSKIISENSDDTTIAIVSHGGFINQLYQAFLQLPVVSGTFFSTGDTGIHEWLIKGQERYVIRADSLTHLAI